MLRIFALLLAFGTPALAQPRYNGPERGPVYAEDSVTEIPPSLKEPIQLHAVLPANQQKVLVGAFKLTRTMNTIVLHNVAPVDYTIFGPYKSPQSGPYQERHDSKDPGVYTIVARRHPGYQGALPLSVEIWDHQRGSPETTFEQFTKKQTAGPIPDDLPLADRQLCLEFPVPCRGNSGDPNRYPAWVRQALFAAASRGLFVYAAFDLDKNRTISEDVTVDLPRKNEPLLMLGRDSHGYRVFAADGASYEVALEDLRPQPDGPVALPATARPVDIGQSLRNGFIGPAAEKRGVTNYVSFPKGVEPLLKKYQSVTDKYDGCVQKTLMKYGGARIGDYAIVTYRAGKVSKIEGAKDRAWDEIDAHCHLKQADKEIGAVEAKLLGEWTKERQKKLDEIRAAWNAPATAPAAE